MIERSERCAGENGFYTVLIAYYWLMTYGLL